MYDTIHKKVPQYLSDLFPLSCESNPYKSRLRENTLKREMTHIPRPKSFKGSFSYRGAKLWNSLPLNIKSAKSKAIFKKRTLPTVKPSLNPYFYCQFLLFSHCNVN